MDVDYAADEAEAGTSSYIVIFALSGFETPFAYSDFYGYSYFIGLFDPTLDL